MEIAEWICPKFGVGFQLILIFDLERYKLEYDAQCSKFNIGF